MQCFFGLWINWNSIGCVLRRRPSNSAGILKLRCGTYATLELFWCQTEHWHTIDNQLTLFQMSRQFLVQILTANYWVESRSPGGLQISISDPLKIKQAKMQKVEKGNAMIWNGANILWTMAQCFVLFSFHVFGWPMRAQNYHQLNVNPNKFYQTWSATI